jgi:LacI family transcriptional regulator
MSSNNSRRRDVTVADVAKAAQVSKAQAARALGNYGAVSEEVRERVLGGRLFRAVDHVVEQARFSIDTGGGGRDTE